MARCLRAQPEAGSRALFDFISAFSVGPVCKTTLQVALFRKYVGL